MEQIGKLAESMSLENYSKTSTTTQPSNPRAELSIYKGGKLTKEGLALAIAEAKTAFPSMPNSQLRLLKEMFKREGFTDQRALDSVRNVIKNYIYSNHPPALANFLSYDMYYLTYQEALEIGLEYCEIADKKRKLWRRK